jgi:RES domain
VIEQFARKRRADAVLRLAALPKEPIEAILLRRGITDDSVAEVKEVLAELNFVLDAQEAVAYSFREPYRIGRFSDGQFPVFYSALEEKTCIAEISYRYAPQFEEQLSGAFPYDRYYHLITCNFAGMALTLVGEEEKHPALVSPTEVGYPFCQQLAKAAREEGIDAFYTRSAREPNGTCVPIFTQSTLSNAKTECRFRFYAKDGAALHERLP